MDTDSLPSALIFIAFLLLFSYLSLAERSGYTGGILTTEGRPYRGVGLALSPFKHACVIAVALSGFALSNSVTPLGWWPITILSLALLVALAIIERSAAALAARRPSWADKCSRPLARIYPRHRERRPLNGTSAGSNGSGGGDASRDPSLEREQPAITEEELVSLDQRDREMLRSILKLDISTAREIMVPRLDILAVELNSTPAEAAVPVIQSGHSRLPVYDENLDHIVGIIHSRDLLEHMSRQGEVASSLHDLVRPAFFIPESKRLDDLLDELQDKGLQMAIVVDEYGGTEGLLTMEDLLEEIVGEIEDEFTRAQEPQVVHLPGGAALVDAGVTTEHVEELFNARLDSPDVDTVGGFVYRTLGKIPQAGDKVVTDHLNIEVVSIMGRRLRKLRISRVREDASTLPTG